MRRIVPAFATAAFLAGCTLGPQVRLTVVLPDPPPGWSALLPSLGCMLRLPDGGSLELHSWESGRQIVLDKAGNLPVLAYPVVPGGPGQEPLLLRPAGGVYPGAQVDGPGEPALQLTWVDGAAATLLFDLLAAGRDTSLFNAERLSAVLREEPDPWDVDLPAAEEAIAAGDFSIYDIDRLPVHDVSVATGPGTWVTESPLRAPITAGPSGQVALKGMAEGLHNLVATDGRVVRLEVGPRDTVAVQER